MPPSASQQALGTSPQAVEGWRVVKWLLSVGPFCFVGNLVPFLCYADSKQPLRSATDRIRKDVMHRQNPMPLRAGS